jgi:hypothetical protein
MTTDLSDAHRHSSCVFGGTVLLEQGFIINFYKPCIRSLLLLDIALLSPGVTPLEAEKYGSVTPTEEMTRYAVSRSVNVVELRGIFPILLTQFVSSR